VTGGGGAKLEPANGGTASGCSPTNAYSLGWGYTNGTGSSCGAGPKPTNINQVFHYLKVTVSGSTVNVQPINAAGAAFDGKSYNFANDTTAPTGPTTLTVTSPKSTSRALTWNAATDSNLLAYDIYRNGTYLATVPGTVLTYTDAAYVAGATYTVKARDLAGNVSAGVSGPPAADTTAPSGPTTLVAGTPSASAVPLSWDKASDNVGVTGYRIYRSGTLVTTVTGLSYTDTGLLAGTTYQYKVTAVDAAGNESAPGAVTSATTSSGASGTVYTLSPTDDATIDPVTTDALTASRLKADANTPVNDLLMKFVVPASCSTVTSATLTLTVGSGSTDPSVRGGDFYAAANSNWSESAVTWATAPAKAGSPVSIAGAVVANTAYSKDVTSLVPTTGGTFSIRGSNTSGDGAGYFSKEGSATAGPKLQVTCG
jgi:chitodextrinase